MPCAEVRRRHLLQMCSSTILILTLLIAIAFLHQAGAKQNLYVYQLKVVSLGKMKKFFMVSIKIQEWQRRDDKLRRISWILSDKLEVCNVLTQDFMKAHIEYLDGTTGNHHKSAFFHSAD